jgi:hypothetical protein
MRSGSTVDGAVQPRRRPRCEVEVPMPSILGAHPDQAGGDDRRPRARGGVLDHRLAAGQGRRHHRVVGGADRDLGKGDAPPVRPPGAPGDHVAASIRSRAEASSAMRCRSTGRVPMAQPPGSDTRAWPQRASSGPSTQKLARMRETSRRARWCRRCRRRSDGWCRRFSPSCRCRLPSTAMSTPWLPGCAEQGDVGEAGGRSRASASPR